MIWSLSWNFKWISGFWSAILSNRFFQIFKLNCKKKRYLIKINLCKNVSCSWVVTLPDCWNLNLYSNYMSLKTLKLKRPLMKMSYLNLKDRLSIASISKKTKLMSNFRCFSSPWFHNIFLKSSKYHSIKFSKKCKRIRMISKKGILKKPWIFT